MRENDINCEVIQDLLPLYEDGCVSERSGKIVEEHLAKCRECRDRRRQYREELPKMEVQEETDIRGIRKGIGRIKRWRLAGIISLCLALTVFLVILPAWNYVSGSGLTYANLKAAYTAFSFEKALTFRDYEKAYSCLDMESHYENILSTDIDALKKSRGEAHGSAVEAGIRQIEENGFDWYAQVCRDKFLGSMKTLEDMGEMVSSYSRFQIERQPFGWSVRFDVKTASGQDMEMTLQLTSKGITEISPATVYMGYDSTTGEIITRDKLEEKTLVFDRFYRSPSMNETVMELLYGNTDYDWSRLFAY